MIREELLETVIMEDVDQKRLDDVSFDYSQT
jgi:hypothetical protein